MSKTKCIVIGNNNSNNDKEPIEFVKHLNSRHNWLNECRYPIEWNNIELITKSYQEGMDLMFAYDTNRPTGYLYLGYWNDGVV